MRSPRGLAGAALVLLSYLAAIGTQLLFEQWGDTVVHFAMGTGFIIFATSVFDFGLPLWVNILGAAASGSLGAIFLMQGVTDLTGLEGLRYLSFTLLGGTVERLLPDVMFVWFIALLLRGSSGKSRILGWAVMGIVVALELTALATFLLGVPMPNLGLAVILLPFVWLLFESAKKRPALSSMPRTSTSPTGLRPRPAA